MATRDDSEVGALEPGGLDEAEQAGLYDETPAIEARARVAWQTQDFAEVANIVFADYGEELYSFLLTQFRHRPSDAHEVFSEFSEDFWRAVPGFQWRCSIRAWCYKLARSAASRHRRAPHNRADRRIPLSDATLMRELAERARSTTQAHMRTEVKDKIRELREQLSQEDQDLLVLRVDRDLSWRDVVHAMHDSAEIPDDEELRRLEVAFRQRFTEVKKRIRRLAELAGLI
jgi:RNA polymerase sigma-70 factor, ECF subfamily